MAARVPADDGCDHEATGALLFARPARSVEDHLAALDLAIERFGARPGLAERRLVARCLFAKAQTLAQQGRHGEAVAAAADLERRAADEDDVVVSTWLGSAMAGMGASFARLWLHDRARDVFLRAADRFGRAADAEVRVFAPRALCDACVAARDRGETEASIAAARRAWQTFGRDPDAEVRYWAAWALQGGALTAAKAAGFEDAARDYQLLYASYRGDDAPRVRAIAIAAAFDEALLFDGQGREGEAMKRYDEIAARHADDAAARETVVKALLNLAAATGKQGRAEDELAIYERIDARYGDERAAPTAGWVAAALRNRALTLIALRRSEEARPLLRDLVERYRAVRDDAVQAQVRAAERELAGP